MLQDDFALVLLEDVDENLYLTETLPSAGTPVRFPQMMATVSEMVGGTEKNPMKDVFLKIKLIRRKWSSSFFNTFLGVSFFLGNVCGVFAKTYRHSRERTLSPL